MLKPFTEHGYHAKAEKVNTKRIEQSKAAAGITEEINTYTGWKQLGL
ncbi:MAG: hypothetical protein ACLVBP_02595 [Ruminococcus sp.]